MLSEQTFDTGELRINYAEGPASGPPLVLLHGLTEWWRDFEPLIAHLTSDWHVYACDLRGHGKSGRAAKVTSYRIADFVRDSVAFVRGVVSESQPIVLIGFSNAGLTALGVAATLPEHVRGLVLLDPTFLLRNSSIRENTISNWLAWVHETTRAAQSYEDLRMRCREWMPNADDTAVTRLADRLSGVDPNVADLSLVDQSLKGFDLESAMQRLQCPALILRGEPDNGSVMSDEDAALAQTNLTHATVIQVPGTGHPIHHQQLETVLQHMQIFLRSI